MGDGVKFLEDILDPQGQSFEAIGRWINTRIAAINSTDFTPEIMASFTPVELTEKFESRFGAEDSPVWRRFFMATLLADWACYEKPVDRVDFPRLKYIMSSSAQYFRLWCVTLPDGQVTPVGYSAWYPISKFVYDGVMSAHSGVDDRGAFLPLRFVRREDIRYGYGFNISIIKQLRATTCSHRIIRAYRRDATTLPNVAGMAITVDAAGRKLSHLLGASHLGDITVQGEAEGLFVRK